MKSIKFMDSSVSRTELLEFYKYKRIFLFLDEWSFYIMLTMLYMYSFPFLIIGGVLFYGGSALYTSYDNLDKIEKMIVPVEQNIYIFEDKIRNIFEFLEQVKDYFSVTRQSPFHQEANS